VSGNQAFLHTRDFIDHLGEAGPETALPASLRVLRLGEIAYQLYPFLWDTRPAAPAPVTIPVLELRASNLLLLFAGSPGSHDHDDSCLLPTGFGSLQIVAECISLAREASQDVVWCLEDTSPAEELCRFFKVAPQCYAEIKIYAPAGGLPMAAPAIGLQSFRGPQHSTEVAFVSLEALAEVMEQTSTAGTLALSVLHDQQCLRITRPWMTCTA